MQHKNISRTFLDIYEYNEFDRKFALSDVTRPNKFRYMTKRKVRYKATILQRTRPYMATKDHKRPQKIIQGHIAPYKAIQGHTRPYKAIHDYTRAYKATDGNSIR